MLHHNFSKKSQSTFCSQSCCCNIMIVAHNIQWSIVCVSVLMSLLISLPLCLSLFAIVGCDERDTQSAQKNTVWWQGFSGVMWPTFSIQWINVWTKPHSSSTFNAFSLESGQLIFPTSQLKWCVMTVCVKDWNCSCTDFTGAHQFTQSEFTHSEGIVKTIQTSTNFSWSSDLLHVD